MKIVIDPVYNRLATFIRSIPSHNYNVDRLLRRQRNTLEQVSVDGTQLVIKKYKRPIFINRIVYGTFRKSKARRSFEYAKQLLKMGFESPQPVAYIDILNCGLYQTGYYIYLYTQQDLLDRLDQYDTAVQKEILGDFADFTVRLNHSGVIHYDYNPSNIFLRKRENGYAFSMIDINRMQFLNRRLTRKECIVMLEKVKLEPTLLDYFIDCYTRLQGWETSVFKAELIRRKETSSVKRQLRHSLGKTSSPSGTSAL